MKYIKYLAVVLFCNVILANTPPELKNFSVTPKEGMSSTEFTFEVVYFDAEGDGNTFQHYGWVDLEIDGKRYRMPTHSTHTFCGQFAGDCRKGITFSLKLKGLRSGNKEFRFHASDNRDVYISEFQKGLKVFSETKTSLPETTPKLELTLPPQLYTQKQVNNKVDEAFNSGVNHVLNNSAEYNLQTPRDSTPFVQGWLYSPSMGWVFTNNDLYPFVYFHNKASWLYYDNDRKNYFNYSNQSWER